MACGSGEDGAMGREAVWPLFGLRLETPSLLLRSATEDDMCALAAVLPPDVEVDPSLPSHEQLSHDEQRAVGELQQQYWRNLGSWTAASWKLPFVVQAEGALVGTQTLEAEAFTTRRVETASWLVAGSRGRGRGREMRAAMLELAFAGLSAGFAVSSAWHDNHPSLGVSHSLVFVDNGVDLQVRGGRVDRLQRMILTAERWRGVPRPDVTLVGLEDCLALFGLA